MNNQLHFEVRLKKNRSVPGKLFVFEIQSNYRQCSKAPIKKFNILGRGSRGNGKTQYLNRGNTPTGFYEISELVNTKKWSRRSYGANGAFRLKPLAGQALVAQEVFGRTGLLIHGGATRKNGKLRPTYGCLRLRNKDVKQLKKIVTDRLYSNGQCHELNITVQVLEN